MRPILYHYWRSTSSWRVRWALAHKGVDYEPRAVDLLKGEQLAPDYVAGSPLGHVPCLVVDGRALSESVAILEYLEESVPKPPLFPADPWLRARTRQVVELINSGIQPLQNLVVLRKVADDPAARQTWLRHWVSRGLAALERELELVRGEGAPGPFAMGADLTAADLFIVPQLYAARRNEVDLSAYPRVVGVEKTALATPGALASHPDAFKPLPSPGI